MLLLIQSLPTGAEEAMVQKKYVKMADDALANSSDNGIHYVSYKDYGGWFNTKMPVLQVQGFPL